MKHFVKPLSASIAAAVLAAASFAPVANAEVSASAGVSSMYLWRGQDLGTGSPAVFGDIKYSIGGFYTGIWGSSGDTLLGNEYDLFAGYGLELGGFKFDLSVWNYNYSDLETSAGTFGDLTDVILTVGFGPVSFSYYDAVASEGALGEILGSPFYDETAYEYYTLGLALDKFSAKLGYADPEETSLIDYKGDYVHVDLGYAYNSNLSFTLSQIVESDEEAGYDEDLKFVVTYALPIL